MKTNVQKQNEKKRSYSSGLRRGAGSFSARHLLEQRSATNCLAVTLNVGTLLVRQKIATQLTTSGDQGREFRP